MAGSGLRTASPSQPSDASRLTWLCRGLCYLGVLLWSTTWQLWTPQSLYPQVPLLQLACYLPGWVDWLTLLGIVASLLLLGAHAPHAPRRWQAFVILATCLILQFIGDQHRLQPWAYEFLLIVLVMVFAPAERVLPLLRLLTVSIYFHSALSKADITFFQTLGYDFFSTLLDQLGLQVGRESRLATLGIACFPLGEIAIAGGLCFRTTRRLACLGSLIMHSTLLIILGPTGLDHQTPVLLWNAGFMLLNLLLFWNCRRFFPTKAKGLKPSLNTSTAPGIALAMLVLICPFLAPWQWFDHWPAWGLYSPSAGRVSVFIHRQAADRIAPPAATYLVDPNPDEAWLQLDIDRWSLEELHVPIYPQARFQLGVAKAVARQYHLDYSIRAYAFGPAARFSGIRRCTELRGIVPIQQAAQQHWLNAHPRTQRASGANSL